MLTPRLFTWTLICFAHDEGGSRYFGSPSLSKSQWFVCSGLGCAFLAAQVFFLDDPDHSGSSFTPFSRLSTLGVF